MRSPSPPDPNPGMLASAQASERVANEQLALAREQFAWSKEQSAADREFIKPFLDQQMRIADSNEARANDYYNYEKAVYRPLETSLVNDAQAFDTDSTRERLSREAVADVGQQMGQAREATVRNLSRYGVNPSSTAFANSFAAMDTQEGLAKAQAGTNARLQATALGHAMKMDAAGLGRNLASNASTAYGIALNANQGAQSGRMGLTASENGMRQGGISDYGMAQSGYGNAGNLYNQEYGQRYSQWNGQFQQAQAGNQMIGSLVGTAAGMFAPIKLRDGGQPIPRARGLVRGPGSTISDSIPARLSKDEYVIPADVVKHKGVEFFDRLIEKYHTPAAMQQKGVRR